MTMPPMTAQEITDIILKAVPQSKTRKVGCRRSVTVQMAEGCYEKGEWWTEQDMPLTGELGRQLQEIEAPLLAKVAALQDYAKRTPKLPATPPSRPSPQAPTSPPSLGPLTQEYFNSFKWKPSERKPEIETANMPSSGSLHDLLTTGNPKTVECFGYDVWRWTGTAGNEMMSRKRKQQ